MCKYIFALMAFLMPVFVSGQVTQIYVHPDQEYKAALDLFAREMYTAAQQKFDLIVDKSDMTYTDITTDAEYYAAICSIELFNPDAEHRIGNFIMKHPESPRIRMAYYQMGRFQYQKKDYKSAVWWFEKVNKYHLDKDQVAEFYFKLAYSYMMNGDTEKADKIFYELLPMNSKYTAPATYYYSHMEYVLQNYQTALNGFLTLKDDPTFSVVVPYYVTQIYFQQKKYEKVIEYAPPLLESISDKRAPEVTRIIGESYYRTGKYAESLYYLLKYKARNAGCTREDIYQLAYVYYKLDSCKKAKENFELVTNSEDLITQNAFYHIADCNYKMGDKRAAMLAFMSAARFDFDKKVKELSMLNYARLSFELSYSPFNETLEALHQFLEMFPQSDYRDEVYNLLVQVYLTSKNYQKAIESIEKITEPNHQIKTAYQRVTLFRGLELFNNLQIDDAIRCFDKSLTVSTYDRELKARALYWRAEACYKTGRYNEAISNGNDFLLTPGAYALPFYHDAYYNLGYACFKLKQYADAAKWFRKYTENATRKSVNKQSDSYIRTGDCYFILRDYQLAFNFYSKAAELGAFDVDYALYQAGTSLGILKDFRQKIVYLERLLKFSNSTYIDDALFEVGQTYVQTDSSDMALKYFSRLVDEFPQSSYVVQALPQMGLLYFNKDDFNRAIEYYKKTITDYPSTPEATEALTGIKNAYIELKDVDAYFVFLKKIKGDNSITLAQQDSLTYLAAEKTYIAEDYLNATGLFTKYLQSFPSGLYLLNSRFYLADCYIQLKNIEQAIENYQFILDRPKNIYTEKANLMVADLCFNSSMYDKAYQYYQRLEKNAEIKNNIMIARLGQMRSAFRMKWFDKAITAANSVILTEKLQPEVIREVHLVLAECYKQQNKFDFALAEYKIIASDITSEAGTNARIQIFEILIAQKQYDQAEKEILSYIALNPPFPFWVARSFMMLSDIYMIKKQNFSAKTTLQSIIDNYPDASDGIVNQAKTKLDAIIQSESKVFKKDTVAVDELKFPNQNIKNE